METAQISSEEKINQREKNREGSHPTILEVPAPCTEAMGVTQWETESLASPSFIPHDRWHLQCHALYQK